jgi:DNA modification methylase
MNLDVIFCGDCLEVLPTIPDQSVDAFITDPPYPHIKRDYGYWTTEEWWEMVVEGVIPEVRRILKPTGSAVFILQPNSKHVGQMRGWLFEFQAWVCREWNMVQDVWWWNVATMPTFHTQRKIGLTRQSLKACVWCGVENCYRNQDAVLWTEAETSKARYAQARASGEVNRGRVNHPSGHSQNWDVMERVAKRRGGVTPFNVLPFGNTVSHNAAGVNGHSAGTPLKLADWWVRYIVPPGGVVCDPFFGVGTMGVAAKQNNCHYIGIDRISDYVEDARERIALTKSEPEQMELFGE